MKKKYLINFCNIEIKVKEKREYIWGRYTNLARGNRPVMNL